MPFLTYNLKLNRNDGDRMKIYTRTGDGGETGLATGKRVLKCSLRIEAYGSVDEANVAAGTLRTMIEPNVALFRDESAQLLDIQSQLFSIGSELALSPLMIEKSDQQFAIGDKNIICLEESMDRMDSELCPLRNFVLPGGSMINSSAHQLRVTVRRAERATIRLNNEEPVRNEVIRYLNRLSDWSFVLSRLASSRLGTIETPWTPRGK